LADDDVTFVTLGFFEDELFAVVFTVDCTLCTDFVDDVVLVMRLEVVTFDFMLLIPGLFIEAVACLGGFTEDLLVVVTGFEVTEEDFALDSGFVDFAFAETYAIHSFFNEFLKQKLTALISK